jgi:hypothetical protein
MDTRLQGLLEGMESASTNFAFQQIRLQIDEGASNPPSADVIRAREAWFRFGLRVFETQFVDVFCGKIETHQHVPNVPIEGGMSLAMNMDDIFPLLTPEYLGETFFQRMRDVVLQLFYRLLHAFQDRAYLVEAWSARIGHLNPDLTMLPLPPQATQDPPQPAA